MFFICFPELMYDPKAPLSVFFMAKRDRKDKIINQNQEDIEVLENGLIEREKDISDLKEKIKEKYVKKKGFSSVSVQKEEVPGECSPSRNPSFHPDEHLSCPCTDKPHTDKLHAEKPQVAHTRKPHLTLPRRLTLPL